MPYVHSEPFRVRQYQCDQFGEVHAAYILRYMQEAALEASAAVGFSVARYHELGLVWLAYETDVEYFQPQRYGERVHINTWVQDFRRVRSLRRYDVIRDGELIACASTDWVLLDANTMRPASIKPEMIDAYSQGQEVPIAPKRQPQPTAQIPQSGVFTILRRARWHEIDGAGHVNNAVYLDYAEDCELQAMAHFGYSLEDLNQRQVRLANRHHHIKYKQAAVLDDEVEISTWVATIEETTILRHTVIRRVSDGAEVAQVSGLREWLDLESGAARPIPADFHNALAGNMGS